MHPNVDIEAQVAAPRPPGETDQSQADGDTGQASPVYLCQQVEHSIQRAISRDEGGESREMNIDRSEHDDPVRYMPPRVGGDPEAETQADSVAVDNEPSGVLAPSDGASSQEPEERRMIGDFDGSAGPLWALYGKEAKSQDEARILSLKDDMDGVLIFAGLFSAALTGFIIDSKQNLQASPADQMVYYLTQNVAILDQISRQISSIAPQVSIPSAPPLPFPTFKPSSSDIRINVFWFMALVFSLSAALIATLVQQWVRDYMHVFQRYSDPLKSARLRQYLHEGSEGWYMPVVAEAVPGLLHVSLFLFFVGLCLSVLNINTTVGLGTTIPIGIIGILYVLTTFAPVIYPQSPYQNSFSGLIWYLIQKLGGRRYKDRGSDGGLKSVSSNMAEGQMQLAMEETEARKGRDERAIRWLVGNMTEDAEMESFVMAIPGSFNGEWGVEVWKKVSNTIEDENKAVNPNEPFVGPVLDTSVPAHVSSAVVPSRVRMVRKVFGSVVRLVGTRAASNSHTNTLALLPGRDLANVHQLSDLQGKYVIRELSTRVAHLSETCMNQGLFASDELWRRRTRACVETTASLVLYCAGAKVDLFGDMAKLLGDIGEDQKIRELSLVGKDQLFVIRWTCLSLMAIRPILDSFMRAHAREALAYFERTGDTDTGDGQASTNFQMIEETLQKLKASRCLQELYHALMRENPTQEEVTEILCNNESRVSELEHINLEGDIEHRADSFLSNVRYFIDTFTHGIITRQLPGVELDDLDASSSPHFSQIVELFTVSPEAPLIIFHGRNFKRICSLAPTLREILEGGSRWNPGYFQEMIKTMRESIFLYGRLPDLFQRQIWRLQDLRDGGGLGFTVELFFLALRQLLSKSSSKESHSEIFIGTFRAITSDWREYKDSLGTQKLLLAMVTPGSASVFGPDYIMDELLVLLGNVFEGQTGPHIDNFVEQLALVARDHPVFDKALGVITRARATSS